ncbi:RNA methyltransferase [Prochlorococcus sp. MIT 1307]|uniref:RNA methyltransferase n=1 Tax=Prochlorococcus sp. MIT 1307 TaxID=3096219 RepID=UPI002A75EF0F|nr:RNA methyltransferase [Prochlorococcus sp. MIT 1307]
MTLSEKLLLSDLLKHRVRCDQGLDHGPGLMAWMHPPVHRLLGWSSRPSHLNLSRHVWRLDQLRGIATTEVFVKGKPSIHDQITLDRIPTLLNSDIVNLHGDVIGFIVDLVFDSKSGNILHYLVSRTDPRIPGTSRWRLFIDRILDQQPGLVSINIKSLDDLPIARSSIRQDILRRSRGWKEQFQVLTDKAGNKLEGWLEEPPWEERTPYRSPIQSTFDVDPLDDWNDNFRDEESKDDLDSSEELPYSSSSIKSLEEQDDPWI